MTLAGKRIAIAGGGIIGLTAALEFLRAGASVTVFERDACMQQASWAAAGMLAVNDPANDPQLLPLASLSRALYPAFLDEVARWSGVRVPLRSRRTLQAGHASGSASGAWSFRELDEHSLDPRDLCAALPAAAGAAGAKILERTAVAGAAVYGEGVQISLSGSETGTVDADLLLVAAGAWSGLLSIRGAPPLPVGPCKGQMIEVLLPDTGPVLEHVIRSEQVYLVPRTGRRVVIGATVENAAFDRSVDELTGHTLLESAATLWPPVAASVITAQWSGLRPMPRGPGTGLPFIGPLDESCRIWVATGHFRNGILLAPATAALLSAMMMGRHTTVDPAPFAAHRAENPVAAAELP